MPTQVQLRRGTASQNNAFTGAQGEQTVDTDNYIIRLHDGSTPGGHQVAMATATQTLTNKTLTTPTVTSPVVSGGTIDNAVIGGTTPAAGTFTTITSTGLTTVNSLLVQNQIQIGATQITGSLILSPNYMLSGGSSTVTSPTTQNVGWNYAWGYNITNYVYEFTGNGSTTVTVTLTGSGVTNSSLGITVGQIINFTGTGVTNLDGTWTVNNATAGATSFAVTTNSAVAPGVYVQPVNLVATLSKKGWFGVGSDRIFSVIPDASGFTNQILSGQLGDARFGNLALNGSYSGPVTLSTTATTANVFNTGATTVNAFGAATVLSLGATTGTTTINNPTVLGSQTTQNLWNTVATTINFAGAATTLSVGASTGTTTVNNNLSVSGTSSHTGNATFSGTLGVTGATTLSSTLGVTGQTTLSSNLAVNGGSITTTATTANLINSTATTLNIGGAATSINMGASTGTTTVNNALYTLSTLYVGSGSTTTALTSPISIFRGTSSTGAGNQYTQSALLNGTSTGSTDFIAYGDNYPGPSNDHGWVDVGYTGSAFNDPDFTITGKNDGYLFAGAVSGASGATGNLVLATDSTGSTADIVLATGGFLSSNEKLRLVNSTGELKFKTPTLTSSGATTANVFNAVVTTLNIGGAATTIGIGASTGTTTVNNNLTVTGNLTVNGTTTTVNQTTTNTSFVATQGLEISGSYTGSYSDGLLLDYSSGNGRITVGGGDGLTIYNNGDTTRQALLTIDQYGNTTQLGGTIVSGATTANVFNTTSTTVNAFGAATTLNIGASTGTTTVNNNLTLGSNTLTVSTITDSIRKKQTFTLTTSGTSPISMYTWSIGAYRSGELLMSVTNGTVYEILRLMIVHDGTNVYLSQNYDATNQVQSSQSASNVAFTSSITGGILTVYAACASGTATIKGEATIFAI
jgi:hypothetical protein